MGFAHAYRPQKSPSNPIEIILIVDINILVEKGLVIEIQQLKQENSIRC